MNSRKVTSLSIQYSLLSSLGWVLFSWGNGVAPAQGSAMAAEEPALTDQSALKDQPSAPATVPPELVPPLATQSPPPESCEPSLRMDTPQNCSVQAVNLLAQMDNRPSESLEQPSDTSPNSAPPNSAISPNPETAPPLDLPPGVVESSPVLQEWLQRTPDIADEIANEPSFRSRLRLGYSQFPSSGNVSGVNAGVEDIFVWPGTGLTLSGDYARSGNRDRETYGAQARFYLFPLGGYVNFAPVLGYRQLSTRSYTTSGVDVGMRLMVVPSRGGGADIALSQTWVAPGTENEVGMTGASVGYAVTSHLRLSTDLQFQNSRFGQDSRLGLNLEWLL